VKMHGRTALPAPAGRAQGALAEGRGQGASPDQLMIKDLDEARVIVVVAADTENDVPIVNLRIKKAVSKRGAKLIVVHPTGVDLDRHPHTVHVHNQPGAAAAEVRKLVDHELLREPGGPVAILYGDGHGSEDAVDLAAACGELATKVGGTLMPLYRATDVRGALAVGVAGWDSLDGVEALLSWGPPPTKGISASVKFFAAWDHLPRPEYDRAAVVLPGTSFAERQGSYANVEGRVQFLRPPLAVTAPLKESWEALSELAVALGMDLDYSGVYSIQREIAGKVPALAALAQPPSPDPQPAPVLVGPAHP
jgi:NADH-quinone oxidoreductase subunit G